MKLDGWNIHTQNTHILDNQRIYPDLIQTANQFLDG